MGESLIALCDDSDDDCDLVIIGFDRAHLTNKVIIFHDGVECIDYLADAANELPVFLLLDISMPRLDGHQVLKILRNNERTRYLPVIVMTSSKEEIDITKAYSNHVNSYVVKPVVADQLMEVVKTIGLFWCIHNVNPNG